MKEKNTKQVHYKNSSKVSSQKHRVNADRVAAIAFLLTGTLILVLLALFLFRPDLFLAFLSLISSYPVWFLVLSVLLLIGIFGSYFLFPSRESNQETNEALSPSLNLTSPKRIENIDKEEIKESPLTIRSEDIDRRLQISLIKSWIEHDLQIKSEIRSFLFDDQELEYGGNTYLEERLLLLEKKLMEYEKQKNNWLGRSTVMYNVSSTIVALTAIFTFILSLKALFHF